MNKSTITVALLVLTLSSMLVIVIPNNAFADITYYSVVGSCNNAHPLNNSVGNIKFDGEKVVNADSILYNKVIDFITLRVAKQNSPIGTAYVGVWNSTIAPTNSNYKHLFGTIDVTTLTSAPTYTTLQFLGGTYTLEVNDAIGVFYADDTGADRIFLCEVNGNIDGSNTARTAYASTAGPWTTTNTEDIWGQITLTGSDDPTGGIDCDLPENAQILICRLGGNGALGSAGTFVIGNTTAGTGLLGIGCGIGLVDCASDSDPKTNGLGLLVFIASIFVVVGMFMTTHGAEKTFKMPTFVWAIIIIALSAFFTIIQLIDPVFLIISIIGLIALASPRLVSMFNKGSGGFDGGSTE